MLHDALAAWQSTAESSNGSKDFGSGGQTVQDLQVRAVCVFFLMFFDFVCQLPPVDFLWVLLSSTVLQLLLHLFAICCLLGSKFYVQYFTPLFSCPLFHPAFQVGGQLKCGTHNSSQLQVRSGFC